MPRRVLVVDDSALMRGLITAEIDSCSELQLCGEAVDGDEAIVMARQREPDVVILDQEMPVRDGLSALTPLRDAVPAATIVMFSSAQDDSIHEKAMALGANACFPKAPDQVGALLAYITGV